jgi:hypothetical protein
MFVLTEQACDAMTALYARARKTRDVFELERIDRALDEIVRLNDTKPAAFQIRSAMANASKVILARRALVPCISLDGAQHCGVRDGQFAATDLTLWLEATSALTREQRSLMRLVAREEDPAAIAAAHGMAPALMRQRISRLRKAARDAYAADVTAA